MKSHFAKAGIAAAIAAGLILAPGLSPAQASTLDSSSPSISRVAADSGLIVNPPVGKPSLGGSAGGTVSTYGIWFVPCDFLGFRIC